MLTVDLNADLGEECGDDAAMLDIVTSANLACGMHAGNLAVMTDTIQSAIAKGVRVGAHPSYPDRATFGRVSMPDIVNKPLFKGALRAQLDAFAALHHQIASDMSAPFSTHAVPGMIPYVKAHGALYNDAARHPEVARALVAATTAHQSAVMHQPNTWVSHYAEERGVQFIAEVFADRAYSPDGTLAPRSMEGSVLHDPQVIADRVVRMVTEHTVETIDGSVYEFADVHSVCVHGDTPGSVEIARTVRSALESAGVTLAAPTLFSTRGGQQ